jgi:hypothetical protein
MVVTTVTVTPAPLVRGGRDPYQTRNNANAEMGVMEMLRNIIPAGRYAGAAITAVGETVTIDADNVFWLNVGANRCAKVELTADVDVTTNTGASVSTVIMRALENPSEEGPANVLVLIEAIDPADLPLGLGELVLGDNDGAGVFTEDAALDVVLAN